MKNSPPGPHRWKPGESGNPSGKPKGLIHVHDIQALFGKLWELEIPALEKLMADPARKAGEKMIASVILNALKTGDSARINFLLERMVGKVKDQSEVSVKNVDETLDTVPRENILALLKQG